MCDFFSTCFDKNLHIKGPQVRAPVMIAAPEDRFFFLARQIGISGVLPM